MADAPFVPLRFERLAPDEMRERARAFADTAARRRSVRSFAPDPIPLDVLDECIRAAGTAPSGAHKQPWTFAVVTDPALKTKIREAAEAEEAENYGGRMNDEWLDDLRPFGTDAEKPFLEVAPALIVVLRHAWELREDGSRGQNYYTQESVGIACGMLLAALNAAGLATLTHTPSPMGFLGEVLGRPQNEKAFLLVPVGYPSEGCEVPDLERKSVDEIVARYGD
ncbi:MAG: nitroreductase family protein [Planctomycetota bacterium]